MGKRGPRSRGQRESDGHAVVRVLPGAAQLTRPVPASPDKILVATKRAWKVFWTSPVVRFVDDIDRHVVGRLFRYYDEWERSMRAYMRKRVVRGSMGQDRLSPHADQIARLETSIARLENELGITPMARARLGIAIGSAVLTAAEVNAMAKGPSEQPQINAALEGWQEA